MRFEDKSLSANRPPTSDPEKDSIEHENDPAFQAHKAEFYRLRHEFFKRGLEPDLECLDPRNCGQPLERYTDAEGVDHEVCTGPLCDNCRESAAWEVRSELYKRLAETPDEDTPVTSEDPVNIREFSLRINIRSTMQQIQKDLAQQVKTVTENVRSEKSTTLLLRDYPTGHRTGHKDTFEYWRRCLQVFDLYGEYRSWEKVAEVMGRTRYASKSGSHTRPKSSFIKDVREDHKKALQLIESALHGTFPY
jgi:hypothetical protein